MDKNGKPGIADLMYNGKATSRNVIAGELYFVYNGKRYIAHHEIIGVKCGKWQVSELKEEPRWHPQT